MNNEELYDEAVDAISKLYGDKSVSLDVCKANLHALLGEIEIMLNAIENDIEDLE